MPSAPASLTYRFYPGLDGLDSIHAQWLALADTLGPRKGLPHVPLWYRSQLRCLPASRSMGFSTAWEADRLVAVLPLVARIRRAPGLGIPLFCALELPNDPYNFCRDATIDPAAAPMISLTRLATAARSAFGGSELLTLSQLREDATLLQLPAVRRLARRSAHGAKSLYLPLHPGFHPDQALSSQSRASLNQRRNRLRRFGPLHFKHAPADLPLADAIHIFTGVEASGWKGEAGTRTATRCSPHRLAFLHDLAVGGDGLQINVHLLFAGADPVAAMYGITIATAHLILLMGYDERYAKASPGHLLLHEIIRWALASQLQELDFLSGASHYRQWHPAQRSMHHIATADGSLKGLLLHHANRLRNRFRSAKT